MAKPNPLAQGLKHLQAKNSVPLGVVATAEEEPARKTGRQGKVLIGGFFDPDVHRQLKIIGAEQGKSIQQLLAEAINLIFHQAGKPEIARPGGRILRAE